MRKEGSNEGDIERKIRRGRDKKREREVEGKRERERARAERGARRDTCAPSTEHASPAHSTAHPCDGRPSARTCSRLLPCTRRRDSMGEALNLKLLSVAGEGCSSPAAVL